MEHTHKRTIRGLVCFSWKEKRRRSLITARSSWHTYVWISGDFLFCARKKGRGRDEGNKQTDWDQRGTLGLQVSWIFLKWEGGGYTMGLLYRGSSLFFFFSDISCSTFFLRGLNIYGLGLYLVLFSVEHGNWNGFSLILDTIWSPSIHSNTPLWYGSGLLKARS